MDAYEKSNSVTSVKLNRFRDTEYKAVLGCGDGDNERQRSAQKLMDYLCEKFGIEPVKIYVLAQKQASRTINRGRVKRSTTLGMYHPKTKTIKIYNNTANIGKVVSIKGFAGTLLHEFMHHYDYCYLNLSDSLHTSGFYQRIGDLERKLKK